MLAGTQAINMLVGTLAAIDGLPKRANFHTIGLPTIGAHTKGAEKITAPVLCLDLKCLFETTQTTPFYLIGITGKPA